MGSHALIARRVPVSPKQSRSGNQTRRTKIVVAGISLCRKWVQGQEFPPTLPCWLLTAAVALLVALVVAAARGAWSYVVRGVYLQLSAWPAWQIFSANNALKSKASYVCGITLSLSLSPAPKRELVGKSFPQTYTQLCSNTNQFKPLTLQFSFNALNFIFLFLSLPLSLLMLPICAGKSAFIRFYSCGL